MELTASKFGCTKSWSASKPKTCKSVPQNLNFHTCCSKSSTCIRDCFWALKTDHIFLYSYLYFSMSFFSYDNNIAFNVAINFKNNKLDLTWSHSLLLYVKRHEMSDVVSLWALLAVTINFHMFFHCENWFVHEHYRWYTFLWLLVVIPSFPMLVNALRTLGKDRKLLTLHINDFACSWTVHACLY